MEQLPKETIERINQTLEKFHFAAPLKQLDKLLTPDGNEGTQAERLVMAINYLLEGSLSEIEKLKEYNEKLRWYQITNANLLNVASGDFLNASEKIKQLESQNKELMEALRGVYENVYAPEHGRSPSIESLLKSLPNKEA